MQTRSMTATNNPIVLIHGAPGRGKTTLASRFERPLFFALERGIPSGIEVAAVADADSFEAVLTTLREIYSDGAGDYRTIVFDTLDVLEAHLIEYVCAKYQWKNIEQPAFGKGWIACDDEWRRFLRAINTIRNKHGLTFVLVAHTAIERIDDPRAPSYTCYAPKLHRRARALVMDASDIVGFLAEDLRVVTDENGFHERTRATAAPGRFLFVEGRPAFFAKNRFSMPEKFPVPIDLDITALSSHWTKGVIHD